MIFFLGREGGGRGLKHRRMKEWDKRG